MRVYRSRLAGYDDGELGARWLSPYMTRIDVRGGKWIYSDSTGRNIEYPALAAGAVHDDRVEGVTLSRLDDTWVTVAYGHDLLHVYEKRGDSFRLALQKDRAGNTIALDYDDANRLARLVSSAGIRSRFVTTAAGVSQRSSRSSMRTPAGHSRSTNTTRTATWFGQLIATVMHASMRTIAT